MPRAKITGSFFEGPEFDPHPDTKPKRAKLPPQTAADEAQEAKSDRPLLYACASALAPWLRCEIGSRVEECSEDRCQCLRAVRCMFTSIQKLPADVRQRANAGILEEHDSCAADIVWQRVIGSILNYPRE